MTLNRDRLMDVLDKAHKGPIVKQFDWDTRVIPGAIADKLKKYGLQKTCDPANPINQNLELADRPMRIEPDETQAERNVQAEIRFRQLEFHDAAVRRQAHHPTV